jgi:RNA binding exosome subunit
MFNKSRAIGLQNEIETIGLPKSKSDRLVKEIIDYLNKSITTRIDWQHEKDDEQFSGHLTYHINVTNKEFDRVRKIVVFIFDVNESWEQQIKDINSEIKKWNKLSEKKWNLTEVE